MYKIAICDDDNNYIEKMRSYIEKAFADKSMLDICEYNSGKHMGLDLDMGFDAVFLDMDLGEVDGIDIAIELRKRDENVLIVFFTGVRLPRPEYFEVNPYRYLMKSYEDDKMLEQIRQVIDKMIENRDEKYLVVKESMGSICKINLREVLYISKEKRGSSVHTKNKVYKDSSKVEDHYKFLSSSDFEYAHNSYIVNFMHVNSIEKEEIELTNMEYLSISRSKKKVFFNRFAQYLGQKYRR